MKLRGKKRSKSQMLMVLLADAIGSTYKLRGFKRTGRHTLATIRRALDGAGLLRDPIT